MVIKHNRLSLKKIFTVNSNIFGSKNVSRPIKAQREYHHTAKIDSSLTKKPLRSHSSKHLGFSYPEAIITTSIIGILSTLALPNYFEQLKQSNNKEAQSIVSTIPTAIGAYIDATGELPTKWDELSSIAAVMTNDGPATGELTSPIILPNGKYELSVAGPTDSVYTLTATPRDISDATEPEEIDENRFAIKSCFNISNGASDLKSGNGIENEEVLNCG